MKEAKNKIVLFLIIFSVVFNFSTNCSARELFEFNGYSVTEETEVANEVFLEAVKFSMNSLISGNSIFLEEFLRKYKMSEEQFRKLPVTSGVMAIENWVNTIRYESDSVNWRKKDYFADIEKFFSRGGDCEDFAIAKLALLKYFYPCQETWFVIVQDINLKICHAITVVVFDEVAYVMDNEMPTLSPRLVRLDRMCHYLPLYSANSDNGRIRLFLPNKIGR